MDPTVLINKRVDVLLASYANKSERLLSQPLRMHWQGEDINFTIFAMRHPTTKGKRMVHVFDMSDGINDYRLEFDAEHLTWELISMVEGHHENK